MIHTLKTWPIFFKDVISGKKRFEIRKNDRDFKVSDILVLQEYDPEIKKYTGIESVYEVNYVLHDGHLFGVQSGYILMGIKPVDSMSKGIGNSDKFIKTQRAEHGYAE